jgi:choline/carnitine/betaine transport
MSKIKPWVFYPPLSILVAVAVFSFIDIQHFLSWATYINDWLLNHFGWLYSVSTLFFLILCAWVYISPVGKVRIGGEDAVPLLTRWRWFTISLTTTIAIGILFWGSAEPLYHLHQPPKGLGITPDTVEAARFAMSTMYMHWTFTPYGIYTLTGLMFALVYYNLKQPFSLGSLLYPLLGDRVHGPIGNAIDAICLYSLVAGMAASLGAGILTISGGLDKLLNIDNSPFNLGIITIVIVATFVISAASGLLKGIRVLANINIIAFLIICVFVLFFGPTLFLLQFGIESLGDYAVNFFQRSLYTGAIVDSDWVNSWTVFYWANWLAWTPVTALFLGRLAYGYTVRDYIHYNLLLPALFGCVWMIVFSGTAIHMDFFETGDPLYEVLQNKGPENVMYAVFDKLPLPQITSIFFLLVSFLSYVAGADANTSAMGGISSTGISPDSPEPTFLIKVVWGSAVGLIAWIMVSFAGIDGIKMTSNLGGFPALFLVLAVSFGMIRMIRRGMIK